MRVHVALLHATPQVAPKYVEALRGAGLEADVDALISPYPGLSSAYTELAREMRRTGGGSAVRGLLERLPGKRPPYDATIIGTWSAPYAFMREALADAAGIDGVDGWVAIDSGHASLQYDGTADDGQLAGFVHLAQEAQRGAKLFYYGHSDVKTPQTGAGAYASTTQVAEELVRLAGPPKGLFHVEDFNVRTDDAQEHIAALNEWGPAFLAKAVRALLDARTSGTATSSPTTSSSGWAPLRVERIATPLSEMELLVALRDAHVEVFGVEPSAARLRVAWGHVAHENRRGEATWSYNLGNITSGSTWPGRYYVLHVQERTERDPDVWKWLDLRFRAHASALAGAADYWRFMAGGRYKPALMLFDEGRASDAAWKLSELNYYTAKAAPYAAGMSSLAAFAGQHLLAKLPPWGSPAPKLDAETAELLAAVWARIPRVSLDHYVPSGMDAFEHYFGTGARD